MKKFVSLLMCVILSAGLLCACGNAADGGETGLRNIKWGMTKSEVRKAETAEFAGADDAYLLYYDRDMKQPIVFHGVNTRNKVDLRYYFNSENKLFKIQYKLSAPSVHQEAYDLVKSLMIDEYGDPYSEDVQSEEDESVVVTSWKKAKSDISLSFDSGEGSKGVMLVTFLPNN